MICRLLPLLLGLSTPVFVTPILAQAAAPAALEGLYEKVACKASGGIFSVGAGLRPSAGSNISLETRYTRGTTINTLVDVDKITLWLGYRL
jgi:hypothetical protein